MVNLHPVGRGDVLVKKEHRRQNEDLTVMPQPHGVAKTPSHNTTQFSRDYFHFTWSALHPQRCLPLPALWGVQAYCVLRTKREHKAISRTAGLHTAPSLRAAKRTEQPSETKQSDSQGLLIPSRVSIAADAFIGCAPISCTRARHTDWSLAAKCGRGRGAGR